MSRNTDASDDVQVWEGGQQKYKEGFFTQLQTEEFEHGINEDVVRAISAKRNEPEWMLEFRLKAFAAWLEMEEPHWLKANYKSWIIRITAITPRRPAATAMIAAPLSQGLPRPHPVMRPII